MASKLGDLRKIVGDIRRRVDSVCHEKCDELGLDEKKVFDVDEAVKVEVNPQKRKVVQQKTELKNKTNPPISEPPPSKDDENDIDDQNDIVSMDDEKILQNILDLKGEMDKGTYDDSIDPVETDRDPRLTYSYKYVDLGPRADLEPREVQSPTAPVAGASSAMLKPALKRFATKRLAKSGIKRGYKTLAKRAATKAAAKVGAKTAGKTIAKSMAKKIPFGLGMIPAAAFAANRAIEGDFKGAGLELASGASAALPIIGTMGSLGIDGYLLNRDAKRETGRGLGAHAAGAATKYAANRIARKLKGESFERFNTLYDRAKSIFESYSGIDESVDGYCFDDYVFESRMENLDVETHSVDESCVFFGCRSICEDFSDSTYEELIELFRKLKPDGRVSMEDLRETGSEDEETLAVKRRIRELMAADRSRTSNTRIGSGELNAKEYKKAYDMSTGSSGHPTNIQLWHRGLDQMGDKVADHLAGYGIPQEWTKKMNIPKNLGRLAGAGIGGLMFGPLGALGGYALANWLGNRHDKYKREQYAKIHGGDVPGGDKGDGYIGGLAGATIGSLLGGPVGGVIGAGIGNGAEKIGRSLFGRKEENGDKDDTGGTSGDVD
jgi:hypothetical protein